jgi:hypothetical protein
VCTMNVYGEEEVESSWIVMAHGEEQEEKWRGSWRMEWVATTLHTTSEHGVSSITPANAHTPAASSQLNWRPRPFKWTRPFRRKMKSSFCACHHISNVVYQHVARMGEVLAVWIAFSLLLY